MADQQLSLFLGGDPAAAPAQIEPAPAQPVPAIPSVSRDPATILAAGETACAACQRCELGQSRKNVAYGAGNPRARLMLIGEGPGAQEDEQGLPFVGAAGQLLSKILASVGFDREQDVYIANVVKCRPPGNRVPTPEEMAACRPYLDEQIAQVDPKIVLLAGATALKGVLNRSGIMRLRGEWIEHEGRSYMPIFHPAYLLRQNTREVGGPKWQTWQDMQKVRRRYDQIQAEADA